MEPYRDGPPTCVRCGAARPDHMGLQGEPLCRGCALGAGIDARLDLGRRQGRAGAVAAIVVGLAMLTGVVAFVAADVGKFTIRLGALIGTLAFMLVVWGVRDLKTLRAR